MEALDRRPRFFHLEILESHNLGVTTPALGRNVCGQTSTAESEDWMGRRPRQTSQRSGWTVGRPGLSPAKIAHRYGLWRLAAIRVVGQEKNPGLPPHNVAAAHLGAINTAAPRTSNQLFPRTRLQLRARGKKLPFTTDTAAPGKMTGFQTSRSRALAVGKRARKESAMRTYQCPPQEVPRLTCNRKRPTNASERVIHFARDGPQPSPRRGL